MVNRRELLINVVTLNRLKRLTSLNQMVRGQARGLLTPSPQMLRHRRRGSTYGFREGCGENAVRPYVSLTAGFFFQGMRSVRNADGDAGMGVWRTRMASCNEV